MPKIRLILEDVQDDQAERIAAELSNIAGCKVRIVNDVPIELEEQLINALQNGGSVDEVLRREVTPEQQKAFEEEWSKPHPGHITWMDRSEPMPRDTSMAVDKEFIGEIGDDAEVPDGPIPIAEDQPVFVAINPDTGHKFQVWSNGAVDGFPVGYAIFNRIPRLIQAEGEHTEAANAEVERLRGLLKRALLPNPNVL